MMTMNSRSLLSHLQLPTVRQNSLARLRCQRTRDKERTVGLGPGGVAQYSITSTPELLAIVEANGWLVPRLQYTLQSNMRQIWTLHSQLASQIGCWTSPWASHRKYT